MGLDGSTIASFFISASVISFESSIKLVKLGSLTCNFLRMASNSGWNSGFIVFYSWMIPMSGLIFLALECILTVLRSIPNEYC